MNAVAENCIAQDPLTRKVYTSNGQGGIVVRLDGNDSFVVVATVPGVSGVAFTGDHLYWADSNGMLVSALADGGGPAPVASLGGSPGCFAVRDGALYWPDEDAGTIQRIDLDTRVVTTVATGQGRPVAVWVDASFVYWVSGSEIRRLQR